MNSWLRCTSFVNTTADGRVRSLPLWDRRKTFSLSVVCQRLMMASRCVATEEAMKMAENISVYMIREHLDDIPQYDLLPLYTIRPYQLGDEVAWMRIQLEADQYSSITPALFAEEFGTDPKILVERQFFLCDAARR